MKSLVVEDDAISRSLLESILDRHGEVIAVENGTSAIETFTAAFQSDAPFDLICLDIMMPDMDGHAVLKEIRGIEDAAGLKKDERVTVIMTTALDDSENVLRAYTGRCAAYCVKPVDINNFYEHLQKLKLID